MARTIEGFPLNDTNYLHAVAILQDCFGQTHQLVAAHMQALLDTPIHSPVYGCSMTPWKAIHEVYPPLESQRKPMVIY